MEKISIDNAAQVIQLAAWNTQYKDPWPVGSLAFSPDGKLLAGEDYVNLLIWRVADGALVWVKKQNRTLDIAGIAFSPTGDTITTVSSDNIVTLWDSIDMNIEWKLEYWRDLREGPGSPVYSPNGEILAIRSGKVIRLISTKDGSFIRLLSGHEDWISQYAFTSDGMTLLSGSGDKTIRVWNVSDGTMIRTQETGGWALAFSPDRSLVASELGDYKTIGLLRVSDGTLLHTLVGHEDFVSSAVFTSDGSILASGSGDGTIDCGGFRMGNSSAL